MNSISTIIDHFKKLSPVGKILAIGLIFFVISLPLSLASYKSMQQRQNAVPSPSPKPTLRPFPTKDVVPLQLVIKFKEGKNPNDNKDVASNAAVKEVFNEVGVISFEKMYKSNDTTLNNYYVLKFKQGVNLEDAAKKIYALPEIENAEPKNIFKVF